jgi:hypothetical protein
MRSTRRLSLWAALMGLFVAAVTGCGFSEPPEQQAENFVAAVKPGMTWQQVVAVQAPRRFAEASTTAMGGHKQLQTYSDQVIRDSLAANSFLDGFLFNYQFTADHVYNVWFDQAGNVMTVQKVRTMGDLLR